MPLQVDIDHAKRFVTAAASGVVVLAEVLQYYDQLVVDGGMPYRKLFDASEVAELRLSDDDIMTLGARVSAYALLDPRGPIAILAVDDATRVTLRRYMNLGGAKRPIRLFAKKDQALRWLLDQPEA